MRSAEEGATVRRVVWMLICVGVLLAPGAFAQQTEIPLPEGAVARLRMGWRAYVAYDVCFSPDGEILAVTTTTRVAHTITLWDVSSGVLVRTIYGHTNIVFSVAFSPDGETLASGSRDGTVLLWDFAAIVHPN